MVRRWKNWDFHSFWSLLRSKLQIWMVLVVLEIGESGTSGCQRFHDEELSTWIYLSRLCTWLKVLSDFQAQIFRYSKRFLFKDWSFSMQPNGWKFSKLQEQNMQFWQQNIMKVSLYGPLHIRFLGIPWMLDLPETLLVNFLKLPNNHQESNLVYTIHFLNGLIHFFNWILRIISPPGTI